MSFYLKLSTLLVLVLVSGTLAWSQQPTRVPVSPPGTTAAMEKLSDTLFRIGNIRVDTAKKELTAPGVINDVRTLEFIANTRTGYKAYESAITVETNAVTFNVALLLMGLDKANGVPSKTHFDPTTPKGDPVEIWVEWSEAGETKRIRAEDLVYSNKTQKTLSHGPWVYTGSVFTENGSYLAESDGVLIGFVHTPASIIDSPLGDGLDTYGTFRLNPNLKFPANKQVTLIVKALPKNRN